MDVELTSSDICEVDGSQTSAVDAYHQKAKMHLKERKRFLQDAKKNCKNKLLVKHCLAQANKHLQLFKEANEMIFKTLFEKCFKQISNQECVDLHGFSVNDAIRVLDEFLDRNIEQLEDESVGGKSLMVITGQGKHSAGGISKIKPVCDRLTERRLK